MTTFFSQYWPVATHEDTKTGKVTQPRDWREYPAIRPAALEGVQAPSNTVFVKTGGNALQAVNRSALQEKGVVAVTVPWNARAGNEMLVRHGERWVSTIVPDNMQPGHVFLMRVPEVGDDDDIMMAKKQAMDAYNGVTIAPSQEVAMAQAYIPPTPVPTQQQPQRSTRTNDPDDLLFEESTDLTHAETGIEHDGKPKLSIV